MIKNFIAFALCAAMLLSLFAGCDKQEPVETLPEEPTPAPTQGIQETVLEIPADERPYVGTSLTFLSLLAPDDPRAEVVKQAAEVFEMTRLPEMFNLDWIMMT